MAAYHRSNFGSFGEGLVCDMDGYTYTTAHEWATCANIDSMTQDALDGDWDHADEWAKEMADLANAALAKAEAAVEQWQDSNS